MTTLSKDQLSALKAAHRQLDHELKSLSRRGRLTPKEELRARVLKKEKLLAKDRIRVLMSELRLTG